MYVFMYCFCFKNRKFKVCREGPSIANALELINLTKTRFQKVLEKCMVLVEFVFGGTMFNFKAFSVQKLSVPLSF